MCISDDNGSWWIRATRPESKEIPDGQLARVNLVAELGKEHARLVAQASEIADRIGNVCARQREVIGMLSTGARALCEGVID